MPGSPSSRGTTEHKAPAASEQWSKAGGFLMPGNPPSQGTTGSKVPAAQSF